MNRCRRATLACLCAGLLACGKPAPSTEAPLAADARPAMTLSLQPLSPVRHSFSGPAGPSLNRYYVIAPGQRHTEGFRARLRTLIEAARDTSEPAPAMQSAYVYERNDTLNEGYQGSADSLRGVHDNALVAYARWQGSRLDVLYLIEQGNVVYDLLLDQAIDPPFEFD